MIFLCFTCNTPTLPNQAVSRTNTQGRRRIIKRQQRNCLSTYACIVAFYMCDFDEPRGMQITEANVVMGNKRKKRKKTPSQAMGAHMACHAVLLLAHWCAFVNHSAHSAGRALLHLGDHSLSVASAAFMPVPQSGMLRRLPHIATSWPSKRK